MRRLRRRWKPCCQALIAEPGGTAYSRTLEQRVADAQATQICAVLDEQADRLMEDAVHTTQQADATRNAAGRLDAQADDLQRRADQLHRRAGLLRDERDATKT